MTKAEITKLHNEMEEEEALVTVLKTTDIGILVNGDNLEITLDPTILEGIQDVVRNRINQIKLYREKFDE